MVLLQFHVFSGDLDQMKVAALLQRAHSLSLFSFAPPANVIWRRHTRFERPSPPPKSDPVPMQTPGTCLPPVSLPATAPGVRHASGRTRSAEPRHSNQRCPSLLGRLLQDLKQQVAEGLGDAAVARRRQVEEVEHVLQDDGSVGVDEALADVQELSLLAQPRQPGAHQPVDRGVLLPQGVGTLASR